MDFTSKNVEGVLTWLEKKGYDEWIREAFEGTSLRHLLFVYNSSRYTIIIENEIDGQAFLLLTKKDMK